MNKQEIIAVLKELNKITGFRVSLHGAGYEEIAAYPEENIIFCRRVQAIKGEMDKCRECDRVACQAALECRTTHIYQCRFGITEAISPLYNFGTLTGFLMMGQVACTEEDAHRANEALYRLTGGRGARNDVEIPIVSHEMVESYVKVMTICAQYLTLANAIPSVKPTVAELAKKYISENINRKLSIGDICDYLKCSKSTLLTTFKKQYGITVNTFITEVRLDMAIRLLGNGNMTISEIAAETGFSDQSYFSKVFSARFGIPPSEYRTQRKLN